MLELLQNIGVDGSLIAIVGISNLVTGALTLWVNKRTRKAHVDKSIAEADALTSQAWKELYDQIVQERHKLEETVLALQLKERECEKKLLDHRREIDKIKSEIIMFQAFRQQLPIATWIKDRYGVMKELSDEYERIFLKPNGKNRDDYIGKTDIQMWGAELGSLYQADDRKVMEARKPMKLYEIAKIDGKEYRIRVEKVPVMFGDLVWGTMGYAVFDTWDAEE